MDERSRTGAQPRNTPAQAEIIGYGLLATAVAAGVLYLDGQRPRDIAVIAVAILALLVTLVLIAPRLGEPEKQEAVPPPRLDGPGPPDDEPYSAPAPIAHPDESSPDPGDITPARPARSGRRAKRGRRRR